MKKIIFAIMLIIGTAVTFAKTNDKKKPVRNTPAKGVVVINTKDSTVTYRHSDSALAASMIPDGFKAIEKPR